MPISKDVLNEMHWLLDGLQSIDVGIVVFDLNYTIEMWNNFMQNHSARRADDIIGKHLFDLFPELPQAWFRSKVDSVFLLKNSAFTTWEQRPYLFKFKNYRPITGNADFMYQNSTIIPLKDVRGEAKHVCLIIYDVTEIAINRLELQAANQKLHYLSQVDGLTKLFNRQTWETKLDFEYRRFKRHKCICSLVIFDIDNFKPINDIHGHTTGDEVIRHTAKILQGCIRDVDVAGRYGGEEFSLILVGTNARGTQVVAERIRQKIMADVVKSDNAQVRYTVSIGIAELNADMADKTAWINAADEALYQAKNQGKNRSVIYLPKTEL